MDLVGAGEFGSGFQDESVHRATSFAAGYPVRLATYCAGRARETQVAPSRDLARLEPRRVNEWQRGVASAIDIDHQHPRSAGLSRHGNGLPVYLRVIRSITAKSRSGLCSTTRPRNWASSYGFSIETTESPTRGSRRVFFAFRELAPVQTRTVSPPRSIHTGSTCGVPSPSPSKRSAQRRTSWRRWESAANSSPRDASFHISSGTASARSLSLVVASACASAARSGSV